MMDLNQEKSVMEKILLESIKEQRRSRRWKLFFRLVWLIIIISLLIYFFVGKKTQSVIENKGVAVINLKGIIGLETNAYENISDSIQAALKDDNVLGVIIRANSPGGSPVYSNILYNEILRLKKLYPKKSINVVIEEVCASGCYYIAVAADNIYANPSSIVGSIGVIYTGFGLNKLMEKIGVDNRLIIAGKNKAMGYPFNARDKKQDQMQQEMLNKIHQQFIKVVITGRQKRLIMAESDAIFSGRYWIGEEAMQLGLIDGFATVQSLAREKFNTETIIDYTFEEDSFEKFAKKFGVSLSQIVKQIMLSLSAGNFN